MSWEKLIVALILGAAHDAKFNFTPDPRAIGNVALSLPKGRGIHGNSSKGSNFNSTAITLSSQAELLTSRSSDELLISLISNCKT
jgi:hypothetical protein